MRVIFLRRGLICAFAIAALVVVAGGTSLAILEPQTVRGGFGDGIWWAIVTASTVGYGDIAPSTPTGRVIAVLLMLSGVGLISTLAASITTYFLGAEESAGMKDLRDRMARIEEMLDCLVSERAAAAERGSSNEVSRR